MIFGFNYVTNIFKFVLVKCKGNWKFISKSEAVQNITTHGTFTEEQMKTIHASKVLLVW